MKIYLVRHGEAIDDIEDCYGGIADFVLSDGGRKTAEELANELADAGIEILFSSPYKRAHETASIIGNHIKCEVKSEHDLRERNSYGVLSGINKAKAKDIFAHILENLNDKPGSYYSDELVVGAEPKDVFDKRVQDVFMKIASSSNYNTVCIVTHGNVTRSIYKNLLNEEGKINLGLLAITVIDYKPPQIEIVDSSGVEIE